MDSFLLGVIKQCAALRFSVLRNKPNTEHSKDGKDLQRAQTFDHAACNSSLWYAAEMVAALQASRANKNPMRERDIDQGIRITKL